MAFDRNSLQNFKPLASWLQMIVYKLKLMKGMISYIGTNIEVVPRSYRYVTLQRYCAFCSGKISLLNNTSDTHKIMSILLSILYYVVMWSFELFHSLAKQRNYT